MYRFILFYFWINVNQYELTKKGDTDVNVKIYKCSVCGRILISVDGVTQKPYCCNKEMEELTPRNDDTLKDKHIPVVMYDKNKIIVKIGDKPHPFTDEHYIEWIILSTDKGLQIRYLKPFENPQVTFNIGEDEEIENVYSYCNIHALWRLPCYKDECRKKKNKKCS